MEELNNDGDRLKMKSSVGEQNYADENATEIGTKERTLQKLVQRVALFIAAFYPILIPNTRYITKAKI